MNHLAHLMKRSRLQSTQDGNLVKVFLWEKGKMANGMLEILDGFSLYESWFTGIQSPRFLQVTLNFDLE